MLHEILLALSGQPSPLLDPEADHLGSAAGSFPLLSPPEKALLASLARLSRLHTLLRTHTSKISSSHPSTVCRAVSAAISTEHLGGFQKRILEVEKAILLKDSGYVGGYGIVPLSTIVGEFAPWTRRLEWLWGVARFMQPEEVENEATGACSGAVIIDYLRRESQTGHQDLEQMALFLVKSAETAWMRQLSMWLLYGNVPTFGKDDFFVQPSVSGDDGGDGDSPRTVDFVMHVKLLPKFVSPATASSILFIGNSLNHLRGRGNGSTTSSHRSSMGEVTLQSDHISLLSSLASPISTTSLSNAVTAIRLSLSQTSLSKLLPLPKILEILSLLHEFLLLGRGEFAMALVSHTELQVQKKYSVPGASGSAKAGDLDGLAIKEGEVMAALSQTWVELYSLQNEEDPVDEQLDLARELLHLSISSKKGSRAMTPSRDLVTASLIADISNVSFDDLLFPTPTTFSLRVPPPIDLFLATSDIAVYSRIHAYLLGIRRAQIRLNNLWKHTSLRRSYPSPWGPPRSNTRGGQIRLQTQRRREKARTIQMRPIWAIMSASVFMLSEISSYFQGEVVNGCWQHFRRWLEGSPAGPMPISHSRPGTASSSQHVDTSTLSTAGAVLGTSQHSTQSRAQPHDPETLTVAHRRYLSILAQSVFLTEVTFVRSLRSLLTIIDHLIALVSRLEIVQRNLDLEADEGVVDNLADYGHEEMEIWHDLRKARDDVDACIQDVISRLRDIDDSRSGEGRRNFELPTNQNELLDITDQNNIYTPRRAAGVDRLLMKLDFGSLNDGTRFQHSISNPQDGV